MPLSTQPYKGSRDFYPDDMAAQNWMFDRLRRTVEAFGYEEVLGPLLEPFDVYAAKTGEEIVQKQLYHFTDQGDRHMAIRPEMTPTLARMVAARAMELPRPIRWFSICNFWRYERPQRGRLREFWQLNVDVLGGDRGLADSEMLELAAGLVDCFGGLDKVEVRVSHRDLADHILKSLDVPSDILASAVRLLDARAKIGDEKCLAEWVKLGCKEDSYKKLCELFTQDLDQVAKSYPTDAAKELQGVLARLPERLKASVKFDFSVFRGLDYYTGTVFEMYDISPENNRAIFGGGRYDNLVGLFGGEAVSGIGLGMGDVTLKNFLETHGLMASEHSSTDVFVTLPAIDAWDKAQQVARAIREGGVRAAVSLEASKLAKQLKSADKHGSAWAVILGDDEWGRNAVVVKNLKTGDQKEIAIDELHREFGNQPDSN